MSLVGAIALFFVFLIIVVGISVGMLWWAKRDTFDFTAACGMKVYLDDTLKDKVDESLFDLYMTTLINGLSQYTHWSRDELFDHFSKTKCKLSSKKVASRSYPDKEFNGLTISKHSVEVACDKKLCWDNRDRVMLQKTALGYELLNTCIWALEKDGYSIAIAERFVDPENERLHGWVSDKTDDGKTDAEDLKIWKELRATFDKAYALVRTQISHTLDRAMAHTMFMS